jgi:hypothetical protein
MKFARNIKSPQHQRNLNQRRKGKVSSAGKAALATEKVANAVKAEANGALTVATDPHDAKAAEEAVLDLVIVVQDAL